MLNRRVYNSVIGLCLFWGFLVNFIICRYYQEAIMQINIIVFLISYFVLAILGIVISKKSDNALISFIGYNMVIVPLGAALSIILSAYRMNPEIIMSAIMITAIVTLIMTFCSILQPAFFKGLGGGLFIALTVLIIVEFISIIFFKRVPVLLEWIGCGIFCGYIGFDIVKAQELSPTLDNAVDSAVALYVDIVNLFVRILRIISNKK